MTDKLHKIGSQFRQLATHYDTEVARAEEDDPGPSTDALGNQVEQLARAIVQVPCDDLAGIQLKAAVYAYYIGPLLPEENEDISRAILRSLMKDLLRKSPDFAWLTTEERN